MAKKPNVLPALYPEVMTPLAKSEGKGRLRYIMDAEEVEEANNPPKKEAPSLVKSIINVLNGPKDSIERLAFEVDPGQTNTYAGVYEPKQRLIPDSLLKRIAIQDDLVAAIVQARSNHMSSFGRPRPDRFSTGYVIEPNAGVVDKLTPEQKKELDERIKTAVDRIKTCGTTKGWSDEDRCPFSRWLSMSTRNAVTVGRLATEIIYVTDAGSGARKFHSFRAIDAGTIYKASKQQASAESVRKAAFNQLQNLVNKKLVPEKYQKDEYVWIQVIEGTPRQAFTAEECVVHNFYPVPDYELNGYPVTPIDTMIAAVTTHINITTWNKLYFQNGRASRGMLLIQSDDVDETVVSRVKQQFNASINSVGNAHRMPVFAVGTGDQITWQPIDSSGSRDMEFQYLTDMNARVILSAFMMSPEELPGWAYLSRGTSNQALSESNKEYQMLAARDVGIRPLISQFEDFINDVIFPLIDDALAKICKVKLIGLDAETAEKESVRLQQDAPVHMTFDQILAKVEKKPVGKALGGEFPLNPQFGEVIDKYLNVGQILETFFGVVGASKDPQLAYKRDPFWFQFQQLQQQAQQMQMQAQQAQQQPQDPNGEQTEASGVSDEQQPGMDAETKGQQSDKAVKAGGEDPNAPPSTDKGGRPANDNGADLSRSIDQAMQLLTKSEAQLPPSKRRILQQHRRVIGQALEGWDDELKAATKEILAVVENHKPKKK